MRSGCTCFGPSAQRADGVRHSLLELVKGDSSQIRSFGKKCFNDGRSPATMLGPCDSVSRTGKSFSATGN